MPASTLATEAAVPAGAAGSRRLRQIFSFPVVLGSILFLAAFSYSRLNLHDPDTWWHLAVGEQILASKAWPVEDTYSFTAGGTPWLAHEWLGEVVMAAFYRAAGLPGLAVLVILLAGILFALLYRLCTLRSGNCKAAFLACLLLFPLAVVFFTLRPQLMGFAFLAGTLVCLERFRQARQARLWMLPAIFFLWVNTHGSFAFGLFVLGVYWLAGSLRIRAAGIVAEGWSAEQRRHLAVMFLLCLVAVTLTPYGTRLAAYPLELALLQTTNVGNVLEWQPLPSDLWIGKVFLALLLGFIAALAFFRPVYRAEEFALALFAIYAAATHRRFLLVFVILFAPLLAVLLARWLPAFEPRKDRLLLNAAVLAGVAACVAGYFPARPLLEEVLERNYPRPAMEFLRQHNVRGPLLNEYGWGGYLIWAHGNDWKVFIDGRADIYDYAGVFGDYVKLSHVAPETPRLLRKHGIRTTLLRPDSSLATYFASQPDWERAYEDKVSVVYVNRSEKPAAGRGSAQATVHEFAYLAPDPPEHEIQQPQSYPVRKR